jgi:hypothetical protein
MTNKSMQILINNTAKDAKFAFKKYEPTGNKIIEINYGLPYVGVNCNDGSEYFFQGEEASQLLEEATLMGNKFNVTIEDSIIYMAQSW